MCKCFQFQVTKTLEDFDVVERPMLSVETGCPNVKVVQKSVVSLDSNKKVSIYL